MRTNYERVFTLSEAAEILKIDLKILSVWTCTFQEYLSAKSENLPVTFSAEDFCVLLYISTYWEDDNTDIESIKTGLHASEHREFPFYEMALQLTPIFITPPSCNR